MTRRYSKGVIDCIVKPIRLRTGLHMDLPYPTRRAYRGVWENCRLQTIERNLLGILRDDDLPGSEAPGAWLALLRGQSSKNLVRVLDHSRQDVITLTCLLDRRASCLLISLAQPPTCSAMHATQTATSI